MSFNVLFVRSGEDEDPRLYPIMTDRGGLALEAADGAQQIVPVKGLLLSEVDRRGNDHRVLLLREIKAELVITDARVVLACKNWDQLPRHWGVGLGATVALVDETVERAKAAWRRRGKLLLGHVRYPWLLYVGFAPKRRWDLSPSMRIGMIERAGESAVARNLRIDLSIGRRSDAGAIARQIAQRSARYWLGRDGTTDAASMRRLKAFAHGVHLPDPAKGQLSVYALPLFFPASAETAFPSATATPMRSEMKQDHI